MKRLALVTAIMITSASAFAQDAKPGAAPATPAAPAEPAKQEGKAMGHQKKGMKKGHEMRHEKHHGKAHSEEKEHEIPSADSKGKGDANK